MNVYNIPGKLDVKWDDDIKAIIDTWTTYSVTLDEFREAVLVKGVEFAQNHGVVAWVVDSSSAKGSFTQEIQNFIGSDIFPAFARIGVKYFITITSKVSAITKMTVSSYSAKTGPHGINLVEVESVEDAIKWLKDNK